MPPARAGGARGPCHARAWAPATVQAARASTGLPVLYTSGSAYANRSAIPAMIPFSRAPVETPRITNISTAVRMTSSVNDWAAEPAGIVLPRVECVGKRSRKAPRARERPTRPGFAHVHAKRPTRKTVGSSKICVINAFPIGSGAFPQL